MEHISGEKYISIELTFEGNYKKQKVSIRFSDLQQLITVLESFKSEIFIPDPFNPKKYFSKEKQKSIVTIYFKGVPINDIALQFDCSPEMIKKTLSHKGIETDDKEARKRELIKLSKSKY